MDFDIKDIKSWANRHDIKIGDEGYFINDLESFKEDRADNSEFKIDRIKGIRDEFANCFISVKLYCLQDCFPFFLPLKAVKVDKPEKKYRAFKDLYEFYNFLSIAPLPKGDFCRDMLLKFSFTYREKSLPQYATTTIIDRIDFNVCRDPCLNCINNRDFEDWFANYEIMNNKGEWQPFGVEVKND